MSSAETAYPEALPLPAEAGLAVLQPLAVDFLLLGLYLAIVLWGAALVYQRRDLQ